MLDKLNIPILQTSVHQQKDFESVQSFVYARSNNPTVEALENKIAQMDSALYSLSFSSGMSAIATAMMALIMQGDHIICDNEAYGGTVRFFIELSKLLNISISWVDTRSSHAILSAHKKNTRLVFIETPSNPSMSVTDLIEIVALSKKLGILCIVDNTMLTPALLQPLNYGADLAIYSTTKYMDGHNATMGGAVTSNNEKLMDKIGFFRNTLGTIQTPLHAWLTIQGMKTLTLRMKQHSANALLIADRLCQHPKVEKVFYPGLPTAPDHEVARQQQIDFGGVLSFLIKSTKIKVPHFFNALETWVIAGSFGSTVSLISHPATMIDLSSYEHNRDIVFPAYNLIRLSAGLEDPKQIIEDLDRALNHA